MIRNTVPSASPVSVLRAATALAIEMAAIDPVCRNIPRRPTAP